MAIDPNSDLGRIAGLVAVILEDAETISVLGGDVDVGELQTLANRIAENCGRISSRLGQIERDLAGLGSALQSLGRER